MRTITYTFNAGEIKQINIFGKYLRILAGVGIDIAYTKNGANVGENAYSVDAGYYAEPADAFTRLDITSASAQTVKLAISSGQGGYDLPPTGNVTVITQMPAQAAPANTQKTVTNASAQLVAANTARKFMIIQNKDAGGTIWLNFGAGAATQANGFMLGPLETYEAEIIPTTAIQAIGDAASNANIVVIEG